MKPTSAQLHASDPARSVWVSASAGTGKTRVLVSRLLRLLLAGNRPEKFLCITFTKAAAAEVLHRIQQEVLEWSTCDDTRLQEQLYGLLARAPTAQEKRLARRLLPMILQVPGGMKIMTIHAFCQSVLARFPLEAGIPPGFRVIDDIESRNFLDRARHELLEDTTAENNPLLFSSITRFFDRVYEGNQNSLIQNILIKRYRLAGMAQEQEPQVLKENLCRLANVDPADLDRSDHSDFIARIDEPALRTAVPLLLSSTGKTLQQAGEKLRAFLEKPERSYADYKDIFLTKSNTPIVHLKNGVQKLSPSPLDIILQEIQRCEDYYAYRCRLDLVRDSFALLHICIETLQRYQHIKKRHGVLDYEDQILMTARLLRNPLDSQWVHYKLDGGIDHILVDEAQDTSPAQWAIIKGITSDFFSGNARKDKGERTLFVVGDEKQSIFSFQNADPAAFDESRRGFATIATQNAIDWQDLSLKDNFRSAPLILKLTDQVFSDPAMAAHISRTETAIQHHAFHASRTGSVSVWPLLEDERTEKSGRIADHPVSRLANQIADSINDLLHNNTRLSNGKLLRHGDIMILVGKRNPLVSPLTKALKDRNIPVSSADRLVLNEQLAVQDCLAAMQAALHPQDDYNLSCFLKSPFCGLDEQQIYTLCHGRKETVWQQLQETGPDTVKDYLAGLVELVREQSPARFLHALLAHPCPADTRSGRHALVTRLGHDSEDVLDELLATAYHYSRQENPSAQNFLTWMQRNDLIIKRAGNEGDPSRVRIMTAHASKGLQAPIVFLADANALPTPYKSTGDVLWLDNHADGFLWTTGDAAKSNLFSAAKDAHNREQYSEYYRLLYVALTRAEEQLVVCGIDRNTAKGDAFPSWYHCVSQAVAALRDDPDYHYREEPDGKCHLLHKGKSVENNGDVTTLAATPVLPERLLSRPPPQPEIIRPLRPSRPQEDDLPVFSPLHHIRKDPYKRGQILHSLFRLVPDYTQDEQETVLDNLLARMVQQEVERDTLRREVLSVLRDQRFGHLFTPQARAEVPVVGEILIDGKEYAVSGQIDRLLIDGERILIVDYKTNRPPVMDAEKIPAAYRHQLRAYRLLLEKIYPGKKVETALLWTSLPALLPVDSS